jgi:transcriptional regulator with PAS, ATPase and Fis domain
VNCSGIPETLLESELFGHLRGSFTGAFRDKPSLVEQAHQGTLFLDELGEMSPRMQSMLLRFTETGEVQRVGAHSPTARTDVRLISATNRNLRAQIATGAFREDLFYPLNVIEIQIPALRERGEDVMLLLDHFLAHAAASYQLTTPTLTRDAAQLLMAYPWPGNVRELRNVTERLVLQDHRRTVTADDLPVEIREAQGVMAATVRPPPSPRETGEVETLTGATTACVDAAWKRLQAGEDFWMAVHVAFKARELTRADLLALVDRGYGRPAAATARW